MYYIKCTTTSFTLHHSLTSLLFDQSHLTIVETGTILTTALNNLLLILKLPTNICQ